MPDLMTAEEVEAIRAAIDADDDAEFSTAIVLRLCDTVRHFAELLRENLYTSSHPNLWMERVHRVHKVEAALANYDKENKPCQK